jgi:hypothetical protein
MLDHSLTGSVVFQGGEGEDTIYFVGGVPTKIRLNDQVALLGQILVHGGAIETKAVEQAVEGARRLGILLGEYLVGHDLVSREALLWALEAQLLNKIAYLANLAPEITYSYFRELDLLEGWGGGDVPVGCPLNPILASVRNWMDRARVRATLNRIGKHPLVMHEDSALESLALLPEEQATLDMIRSEGIPLAQLYKRNVADEEVVSSLVYSLAVTRQFAFKGQKKGPMASKNGPWRGASAAPALGASGSIPVMEAGVPSIPVPAAPIAPSMPEPVSPRRQPAPAPVAAPSSSRAGIGPPSPNSRANVGPPPASVRTPPGAAAPGSARKLPTGPGAPAPQTPRAMAPAARPAAQSAPQSGGLPRASAPQIRPITAKKATMVGIQPAATSEQRQAAAAAPPAAPSEPPGKERPSMSPADEAKTIARPSPAFIQAKLAEAAAANRAAKAAAAAGTPAAGGASRPGAPAGSAPSGPLSRPPPALPSKLAGSRSGAQGAAPPGPAGASSAFATKPAPKVGAGVGAKPMGAGPVAGAKVPAVRSGLAQPSPRPPTAAPAASGGRPGASKTNGSSNENDDIEIELDMGGPIANNGAVDLGADMADAEAALEAMQSFRLAEAALQRNDLAGAEELAKKAVAGDPTQFDYVTLLAWIRALNDANAVEDAIATMTRVLSEDPSSERALLYRGKLFSRMNRVQEALGDLNEVLASNPQNRDAQAELRNLKSKT